MPTNRSAASEITQDYESPPPISMRTVGGALRVGVVSTRGNVRRRNEDNFYVSGRGSLHTGPSTDGSYPGLLGGKSGSSAPPGDSQVAEAPNDLGPPGLFIVADGMGGQLAGEKASQMAVELIPRELAKRLDHAHDEKGLTRAIRESVARANEEILAQSHLQAEFANMGTTVGLALFREGKVYVTGLGDSRVYHFRDGEIRQLTRDHSLAHALEEAGTISPEEVETHKFKNILYLYLGSKDVGEGPEDVRVLDFRPGDQFLLSSDGLTGVVKDEVIAAVLKSMNDPQRAAQLLVNRALENQSKDNVTCVVVHVVSA